MKRFDGKVALITGAGSGIGRATAIRLSSEGARIVVAEIRPEAGQETVELVKKAGGDAAFVQCDVTSEESVKNVVAETVKIFGQIDTLCNVAGFPQRGEKIEECDVAYWEKSFFINVKGPWLMSKYALPELKKTKGTITNITTGALHRPRPGFTVYAPAKGAVRSLTIALAVEFAPFGIRVNTISPGPVNTPMLPLFVPDELTDAVIEQIKGGTALGELVEPEDVAAAIAFLASADAAKTTGSEIFVDSGAFIAGRGKNS